MWGASVGMVDTTELRQSLGASHSGAPGLPPSSSPTYPVSSLHSQQGSRSFFRPVAFCLVPDQVPTTRRAGGHLLPQVAKDYLWNWSSKRKSGASSLFVLCGSRLPSPILSCSLSPPAGIPAVVS